MLHSIASLDVMGTGQGNEPYPSHTFYSQFPSSSVVFTASSFYFYNLQILCIDVKCFSLISPGPHHLWKPASHHIFFHLPCPHYHPSPFCSPLFPRPKKKVSWFGKVYLFVCFFCRCVLGDQHSSLICGVISLTQVLLLSVPG